MSAQGLQELRRAEEEAKKQVEAARQDRVARLKQAKAEADKEIAAFKAEQEDKLRQAEEDMKKNEGDFSAAGLQREADQQVQKMAKDVEANAAKVAQMLLEVVMKVDTRIPEARKGVKAG